MSAENKTVMKRIYEEIWNEGKLEVIDELFSPDYVAHFLPPGMPPGREGFRAFVASYRSAFPDGHTIIQDQIAEGDKVVSRISMRGTHRGNLMGVAPTGNVVELSAIVITRIQDGKNVEAWVEQDRLGMLQQLGVVPAG